MKNPSYYEDPPEDEPEGSDSDDTQPLIYGEPWGTPNHAPFTDRDCDYWNKTK